MVLRPPPPHPAPGVRPVADGVVGLVAPLAPALEAALRLAVLEHVATEHRRVFPPVLHVGSPAGGARALPLDGPRLDHALRTDLLEALVRCRAASGADEPPLLWVTRRGTLETQDEDLAWSSAARTAGHELAITLPLVVVTRDGWRDPATGTERTWRRLRPPRR